MTIPLPSAIPALLISEDTLSYNAGVHPLVSAVLYRSSVQSSPVAATMFIFWDHCITFGQEVLVRHI